MQTEAFASCLAFANLIYVTHIRCPSYGNLALSHPAACGKLFSAFPKEYDGLYGWRKQKDIVYQPPWY